MKIVELCFDRGTIIIDPGIIDPGIIDPGIIDPGIIDPGIIGPAGTSYRATTIDSTAKGTVDRCRLLGTTAKPPGLPSYFLWDPRVRRWRAPGFRLAAFCDWLQLRGIDWVYHSPRPTDFLPQVVPEVGWPGMRPYQEEALNAWTATGSRGLVSLPTGSGKTRVAIRAIVSLKRPALVVAPTRQLVHQWVEALREFYPGAVGIYGDGERDLRPITVATYESAHLHLDTIGDHFDLLVADEVHHFVSERLGEIAQMATARFRLGLSGTLPEAAAGRRAMEALFGPVCFALPVARLTGRYLAAVDLKVIPLRLNAAERAAYDRNRTLFLDHFRPFADAHAGAPWEDFVRAASRSAGGREALAALRRSREVLNLSQAKLSALDQLLDRHAGDPTLVFTADNRSAYAISRRFLIPAITCDIEREERESILERFRDGIYRAMISARVLNEGIDVPAAAVAIVVAGSSNPVEHAQRVGRVLRPLEGKKAVVYELVVLGTSDWRASERRGSKDVLGSALTL